MSTPGAETLPKPPLPLSAELRTDVARRRADGRSWEAIGAALRFDPDALCRACAADPAFVAAQAEAEEASEHEAERKALRRLKRLTDSENERVALRASEVLVRYARERRHERAAEHAIPPAAVPSDVPKGNPRPTAPPARSESHARAAKWLKPTKLPAPALAALPNLSADRLAELVKGG